MMFIWLKRYMPRGIYGRAALILMLPVVILQLVVVVLFAQRHFEGVTLQMTDTVVRELTLVMEAVDAAPDREAIAAAVRARAGPLDIGVAPLDPGAVPPRSQRVWYDYSGRVLTARLFERMPGLLSVDLGDGGTVRLAVETDKGPVAVSFDRRRISAANPHQLFVYTLFFGVVMTLIASIYLRNQLRPIKRLARASEAFGRGRHEPYTPGGAVEIRAAGNAFVDMRTPLTRMRLSLAMLDDEEAEPLLRDVDDLQRMLDEFLNFAKGASEGEPEHVDPRALIAEAVEDARRGGHDVVLLPPDGEGSGTVTLRRTAIRRAVDNLISNAVRYGARAEVSVMLSDRTLRIRVEDDGPGIPAEHRAEALRPFSRLDSARNQDRGGSVGLGLAIATDIARAHGGVLRLGESTRLGGLRADIVMAR